MQLAAALSLLALAGLIEAAMPALRTRRASPATLAEPWIARLSRRMADEPRRTRVASVLLRIVVLVGLAACIALAPPDSRLSLALVVGHYILPFCLLLSQDLKKRPQLLARVAMFILAMRLVDTIFLISPTFAHEGFPIHWMDIAAVLGLTGLWIGAFCYLLKGRALLPVGDPYLPEALADGH